MILVAETVCWWWWCLFIYLFVYYETFVDHSPLIPNPNHYVNTQCQIGHN